MLNAQDIAKRINNPSLSKKEDQDDLKQLAQKYPYSQLFSILYLKALKQSRDVLFEEELKAHSYRITDRKQLYYLIHEENSVEESEIDTVTDMQPEITAIPVIENIDSNIDPAPFELEEKEIETADNSLTTQNPPVLEIEISPATAETTIEEPISNDVSEKITEEKEVTDTVHEENEKQEEVVLHTSIQTEENYVLEDESLENGDLKATEDLDQTILHNVYAANYQLDELSDEEQRQLDARNNAKDAAEKQDAKENRTEQVEQTKSFTSWLHSNENFVPPTNDETEEIKAIVTNFKEFDPTQELFGEVEKPKKEFYSATKKGKKSLAEEGLPVSETLAKIYEMQGNYPKAISAYEQLSLINPEKRTFFASLIEKLKKKLNTE